MAYIDKIKSSNNYYDLNSRECKTIEEIILQIPRSFISSSFKSLSNSLFFRLPARYASKLQIKTNMEVNLITNENPFNPRDIKFQYFYDNNSQKYYVLLRASDNLWQAKEDTYLNIDILPTLNDFCIKTDSSLLPIGINFKPFYYIYENVILKDSSDNTVGQYETDNIIKAIWSLNDDPVIEIAIGSQTYYQNWLKNFWDNYSSSSPREIYKSFNTITGISTIYLPSYIADSYAYPNSP